MWLSRLCGKEEAVRGPAAQPSVAKYYLQPTANVPIPTIPVISVPQEGIPLEDNPKEPKGGFLEEGLPLDGCLSLQVTAHQLLKASDLTQVSRFRWKPRESRYRTNCMSSAFLRPQLEAALVPSLLSRPPPPPKSYSPLSTTLPPSPSSLFLHLCLPHLSILLSSLPSPSGHLTPNISL